MVTPIARPEMKKDEQSRDVSDHALSVLRGFLDRIEMSNGSLAVLANLMEGAVSYEPIPLVYEPGDQDGFEQTQRLFNDMKATSDLVNRLSRIFGDQVETAEKKMKSLLLRNGLSSLPDDVLTVILSYATVVEPLVEGREGVIGIHKALSLSHVCSRFRSLILNDPRAWNFLSDEFADLDIAHHCIKHAKSAPLDIGVYNLCRAFVGSKFEEIVSNFLTAPSRWRSLVLSQYDSPIREDENGIRTWDAQTFLKNASSFYRLTYGLELPSLTSLTIDYNQIPSTSFILNDRFHPHRNWSLPSLQKFDYCGGIPLPFNNTIKMVCISHTWYPGEQQDTLHTRHLQDFLASCTSLEFLDLNLFQWRFALPCDATKFPSVQNVDLGFTGCTIEAVRTICNALYFHNAKEMALKVVDYRKIHLPDYGILMETLLQHPYTGVKSLQVSLAPLCDDQTRALYSIPFANLPSLEHLSLQSFSWPHISLLNVPDGVRIAALRSLTLAYGGWQHVSEWVVALMGRLEEQKDLEKFEVLRIQECPDNGEEATTELKGDILDYLPEHKIVIEDVRYL